MSIQLPQLRRAPRQWLGMLLAVVGYATAVVNGSAVASTPITSTVSAGSTSLHTCSVRNDGTIACWGYNAYGQATPPVGTFVAVSAGNYYTCGVHSDGTLACWGYNGYGQASPPAGSFTAVSAGYNHSCGLRSDGTVACWGYTGSGAATPPSGSFIAVSAGDNYTCGLHSDGTVACWGIRPYGLTQSGLFQTTPPPGTFVAVSAGWAHTCGVHTDGTLACWGTTNYYGELTPPAGTFVAVSAGNRHNCGVRSDGTVACWGLNDHGEANPPEGTFLAVSAGSDYSCGAHSDGTVACWGYNGLAEAPQPALVPDTLADGTRNVAFSQEFGLVDSAWFGDPTSHYTSPTPGFALTAGALPPGLDLAAAGLLSGTPTTTGSFSFTVEGEDANGFVAQHSYVLNIQPPPDTTAPVITPTVSGTLGDNGWYTGNVTISWLVSDPESAITATTGCGTATLSTDALGAGYTCTATSAGGTNSGSVTVKRDATAPALAPAVTPSVILLNGSGTAVANATDALSGVTAQSCAALVTSSIGSHASTCSATDNAGNTATAAAAYAVIYGFVGFTTPVDNTPTINAANAGQAVPFKWKLVDASGTPVTNLASVTINAVAMSCSSSAVTDAVEQYAADASALQNLGGGYYQYNWKSPKAYQTTCKQLVLNLGDGSTRIALFRFK